MNIRQKLGYLVVATLGLQVVANAQEPRQVTVAYRDADVRRVIQQVGQVSDSAVVIEKGVEGKVTFQPSGPMTANEFRSASFLTSPISATKSQTDKGFYTSAR